MEKDVQLSIDDLAERFGLGVRTIRFYISEGLLPRSGGRGKAAPYSSTHVDRLGLILRLSKQRVPLNEIRERLEGLTDTEVSELLRDEEIRKEAVLKQAGASVSPKDYVSSLLERARFAYSQPAPESQGQSSTPQPLSTGSVPRRLVQSASATWERWEVAPGIELHIRGDVADTQQNLVERLLDLAASAIQAHTQVGK